MKRNYSILGFLSIFFIKKIWHGKFGRNHNKRKGIICRFYSSCSNYGIKAVEKYGFFRGWYYTYKRIKRCTNDNTESCIDYP
ncbi:MAG: membrane protein insertion efficiency factor YidD [Candidatus Aenigmarchaeota archaeon]|nr:membrane protein insertion efficiency factor YidD [Candidatus Aenigmarchaeota archaeon]